MGLFAYPEVRREDFFETLHGFSVADPYRHLEDPDAPETKAFVEAQGYLFREYIKTTDVRERVAAKLTELNNFEKYQVPFKRGDNYYYFYNSGLQAQSVLYTQKSIDSAPTVFFDPNTLSADGTVSLNAFNFSPSGNLFGYALSTSGSDWVKIYVRRVGSYVDLEATPIEWAKFSKIEFTHDDLGFFYTKYPTPAVASESAGTEVDASKFAQVWYHRIQTSQNEDIVVYKNDEEPDYGQDDGYDVTISDCGRYLILGVRKGCDPENILYVADLEKQFGGNSLLNVPKFTEIVGEFNASYFLIASKGSVLYFQTSLNAPKSRIVSFDVSQLKLFRTKTTASKTIIQKKADGKSINSSETNETISYSLLKPEFLEIVPEAETPISFVKVIKDKIVIVYMKDVKHIAKIFDLTGKYLNNIDLPSGANISGISKGDGEIFYKYTSHITPGVICRYDFATTTSTVFRETVVKGLEADKFEVKQVFFDSEDGTKIPMWIVHKKDLVLNGENPTILYGYGGFGISLLPSFSINFLSFVDSFNGIYCVANIRGGGEYGQEWHDAGRLFNKQNCFTDFQYAARFLISEKYTQRRKLCINGGSNGGLLVGASINQTPELFGLAIVDVGVLDYLRFHKFTVGAAWTSDYGSPDVQKDFEYSIKISPLHNVDSTKIYPAVLIVTGDHDDRVVPLHSMKFAATLQHSLAENPNPIMMRVNKNAGHGAGKSVQQTIDEIADKFAYLSIVLNAPYFV
ncbi:hypothetical protein HK100_001421 [Physocladia obscura]|uniref:Prolyl endopeptidase n=1 Tax=Physocladia obscura TaxID=109957 RepID=A0AAD5SXV8_9FUNG|nr:hypothetical protein HK100_001421 [Physocladia obscura]